MYKAIKTFVDGENGKAWPPEKGGLAYAPGDPYPKAGFEPTAEHIRYLLGKGNRFGEAVIREAAQPEAGRKEAAKAARTENGRKKPAQKKKGGGKDDPRAAGAAQAPPESDGE